MAASYDEAVAELYQAPHESFVAERKRLAAALKGAGDKAGAARLLKLGRPPLSAWAVNQLWWQAGDLFSGLFAAAQTLRAGDQSAAGQRRDALAALKARAASILVQAGHGANEGTLRRVATTLAALAASGGFDPDPPGALGADRDPPGFDIAALGSAAAPPPARAAAPNPGAIAAPDPKEAPALVDTPKTRPLLKVVPRPTPEAREARPRAPTQTRPPELGAPEENDVERERATERERVERARAESERIEQERLARERAEREQAERERAEREQAERLRIEQDRKRIEAEQAARVAERERLEASLPALRADLERRLREVDRLKAEVSRVEGLAEQARAAISAAEARLAALADR